MKEVALFYWISVEYIYGNIKELSDVTKMCYIECVNDFSVLIRTISNALLKMTVFKLICFFFLPEKIT